MSDLKGIRVLTSLDNHHDDGLAIAKGVLKEVASLLGRFIRTGTAGVVDMRALPPLGPEGYQYLKNVLSTGEVVATVDAQLKVLIQETSYSGVWWVTHKNERDEIVTELIEITAVPEILIAHVADTRFGLQRLEEALAAAASEGGSPPLVQ